MIADSPKEQVSSAKAEIDEFFLRSLGVAGLWAPVAVEALLDRAELLLTGHRADAEEHAVSLRYLAVSISNALSKALQQVLRHSSRAEGAVPSNIDAIVTDMLALCQAYSSVEDAFISYWKGYAKAFVLPSKIIEFYPKGSELDARLRSFRGSRDFFDSHDDDADDSIFPSIMAKILSCLPNNSTLTAEGGFQYQIPDGLLFPLIDFCEMRLRSSFGEVPELNLGACRFADLVRGWAVLQAVSRVHQFISLLLARDPTNLSTSVNWPALWRTRENWHQWFSSVPNSRVVLNLLSFNPTRDDSDVTVTPIVPIDDTTFGLVPSITLQANAPRNLLTLTAHCCKDAYGRYTSKREQRLISHFRELFPDLVLGANIKLPNVGGVQLPDIDLLIKGPKSKQVIVAELKWLLSASTTREVANRNDYLQKGQRQLRQIRNFLEGQPECLKQRGYLDFNLDRDSLLMFLISKGHLGSGDVLEDHSVMVDYDIFVEEIQRSGLESAARRTSGYEYLPLPNKDFVVTDLSVQFGDYRVNWKQFNAPELGMHPMNATGQDLAYRA